MVSQGEYYEYYDCFRNFDNYIWNNIFYNYANITLQMDKKI